MLQFKSVTKQDGPKLRRYYKGCDYGLCEYSVGTKLMWRNTLHPTWTETAGCLVVRKNFADANPAAVAKFLEEYAASIDFITTDETAAAVIAGQEIVPAEAIAKKALPNCHIVCLTGADMAAAATGTLETLFALNPSAVGGALPGEDFWFGA